MTDQLLDVKFKQLCDALTGRVFALGRDPNAVLVVDRRMLKVRLMVTPPPDASWKPFRFHPDHLTGSIDPEQCAADIVAEWQSAASNVDTVGR